MLVHTFSYHMLIGGDCDSSDMTMHESPVLPFRTVNKQEKHAPNRQSGRKQPTDIRVRLPLVSFSVLAHHIAPAMLLCSSQIWQPRHHADATQES